MATKQQKTTQRAVKREHKLGVQREERHVLWVLVALILLLLYLLFAQHYDWWPYAKPSLGSAFYTNVSPTSPVPSSASSGSAGSSSGNSGGSGSNGSNGNNGSNGGSGGGSSTTPSGTPSLLNFAAGVNVGDTKEQTSGQANGLNESCTLLVQSSSAGKQEVCTYTQGDKVVTVTFLNNHVVSASKSGF